MTAYFLIVLELSCRINDLKENIQKSCVYLLMSVFFFNEWKYVLPIVNYILDRINKTMSGYYW